MIIFAALTQLQIIFIIIASVVVAVGLFLAIFIPFTHLSHKLRFNMYCYKLVYKVALYRDYYLVNNFLIRVEQDHFINVDHVLFGEKFIYIIMDQYYNGDLMGSGSDQDLILFSHKGEKSYVENPYFSGNKLLSRFSTTTGISTDLLIGVHIVNDSCRMNIQSNSRQFYMVKRKHFKKLIKKVESRDVSDIRADQLQEAVKIVNEMNERNMKKK